MKITYTLEKHQKIADCIEHLIKNNKQDIFNKHLSIDWFVLAENVNINQQTIHEISAIFVLFYYFFKEIFDNTWDFTNFSMFSDTITRKQLILQYGPIHNFLIYILYSNIRKKSINNIKIDGNKVIKKLGLSEKESNYLFEIFILFYNFYKFFFNNKSSSQINAVTKIRKQSIDSINDYAYLFKNRAIKLATFKKYFSHLHEIAELNPTMFKISGSKINISEKGIKLSEEVHKYNRIGRKPPKELIIDKEIIEIV